jgi:two-component system, chemotaxis family, response regulator Rcp1
MTTDALRTTEPVEILLVEDNPGDVCLAELALAEARVTNHVTVALDGAEALAILRREGAYTEAPRPDLILLDLNLPKRNGREVLAALKGHPSLRTIPVIILTSSESERDIAESYGLGANCYVSKPLDLESFLAAIRSVAECWLSIVKLPPRPENG